MLSHGSAQRRFDVVDADSFCTDRTLLIADQDKGQRSQLGRALEERGFSLRVADSVSDAIVSVNEDPPAFAVVELRLGDGSGMRVVEALRARRPDARIIILTGYGNIASAVAAVKAGAADFLAKPMGADDVARALLATADSKPSVPERPMSAARVRWEHIQRNYELNNHNVSETARRLNMHRRTLQRILSKRAPI